MRFPLSNRRRAAIVACRLSLGLACAAGASLAAATGALAGAAGAASTAAPLPPGNYETHSVCARPVPGRASCMASLLVARSTAARAHLHPLGLAAARQPQVPSPTAGDFGL